jgi:hypothetical protein
MRLTLSQLRTIIKEELKNPFDETGDEARGRMAHEELAKQRLREDLLMLLDNYGSTLTGAIDKWLESKGYTDNKRVPLPPHTSDDVKEMAIKLLVSMKGTAHYMKFNRGHESIRWLSRYG